MYPGSSSGSNHTISRSAAGPVTLPAYWRKACHSPRYPGSPTPNAFRVADHIPSAATTYEAVTVPTPATSTSTDEGNWRMASSAWPWWTFAPASIARSRSAASSSRRGVVAAKMPSDGSGTQTSRPDGERNHAASTDFQLGTIDGRNPSGSSSRRASVVRPSPQHLSRGKVALSMTTTEWPALASTIAAVDPAGPAPMTTTSAVECTVIG